MYENAFFAFWGLTEFKYCSFFSMRMGILLQYITYLFGLSCSPELGTYINEVGAGPICAPPEVCQSSPVPGGMTSSQPRLNVNANHMHRLC